MTAAPYGVEPVSVADVTIPDGVSMMHGEVFIKMWRIRNMGTCTWEEGFEWVFIQVPGAGPTAEPSAAPPTDAGGPPAGVADWPQGAVDWWLDEVPPNDWHRRMLLANYYSEVGVAEADWGYYFIAVFGQAGR